MSSQVLLFQQYRAVNGLGSIPWFDQRTKEWSVDGRLVSLREMGVLCSLDEVELVMLRLKYGA